MDKIARDTIEIIDDSIKTLNKKKDLSPSDLETMCKAYNLKMEIEGYYGGNQENYSERGYGSYGRGYYDMMSHNPQMYERSMYDGNMRYDGSMRYDADMSSRPMRSPVTGRYVSRDGGNMSAHSIKDRMVARLEEMYDEAAGELEREEIRKEIRNIEANK